MRPDLVHAVGAVWLGVYAGGAEAVYEAESGEGSLSVLERRVAESVGRRWGLVRRRSSAERRGESERSEL